MDNVRKILAPTDLSGLSLAGVRYALEMARSQGAEVTVYHVADYYKEAFPYPMGIDEGSASYVQVQSVEEFVKQHKDRLGKFLTENFADLMPKVTVQLEVEIGVAYEKIVEKAAKEGMDMIVMSTHGRTGLMHMLVGSVTERVVRRAARPVLSIHPQKEARPTEAKAA